MASEDNSIYQPRVRGLQYRKKIGEGGFATVWHFFDPENARDVAVKRLSIFGVSGSNTAGVIIDFLFNYFNYQECF